MERVLYYTAGFLLGAAAGAGLVLLFAPRSGDETRLLIRDRVQFVMDEGRAAAESRREELLAQLETLKKPAVGV